MHDRFLVPWVLSSLGVGIAAGCSSPPSTELRIVGYDAGATVRRARAVFDDAYYDKDADGNVSIALAGTVDTDSGVPGKRIVHLQTVWRPIPGVTVADSTQINGTVVYAEINGLLATVYEGAGSVFVRIADDADELVGTVDLAWLKPTNKATAARRATDRIELSGRFRARYHPRRVRSLLNELRLRR